MDSSRDKGTVQVKAIISSCLTAIHEAQQLFLPIDAKYEDLVIEIGSGPLDEATNSCSLRLRYSNV